MVDSGSIGMRPETGKRVELMVNAGGSAEGKVVIENRGSLPVDVVLYPVDATVTHEGAFALRSKDDSGSYLAHWLAVPLRVRVEPKSQEEVSFSLQVPQEALSGDYLGGIVGEIEAEGSIFQGKFQARVIHRVAVRTYIMVGDSGQLKVGSPMLSAEWREGMLKVIVKFPNTSTSLVDVTGLLEVKQGDTRIESLPLSETDILPKTTKVSTNTFEVAQSWFQTYQVQIQGSYHSHGHSQDFSTITSASSKLSVFDSVCFVGLIVGCGLLLWGRRKRR